MSANDVRKTLRNEAGLLGAMIGTARAYRGETFFTNQATFIQESWQRYLTDRATTNDQLADPDSCGDEELKAALEAERDQIQRYIDVHDRKNEDLKEWITFLECELDILNHLIGKI